MCIILVETCNRCEGKGNIPEYSHILNGVCFNCWGTGDYSFKKRNPNLDSYLNIIVDSKSAYLAEVLAIMKEALFYDDLLQKTSADYTSNYYEMKFNEQLTKIYNLRKSHGNNTIT